MAFFGPSVERMIRKQDVAGLVSLLSHQNPTLRQSAIDGLRRLCTNPDRETEACERVVASLTRLLAGADPEPALQAAITLEVISWPQVIRRLLPLLQESLQPDADAGTDRRLPKISGDRRSGIRTA